MTSAEAPSVPPTRGDPAPPERGVTAVRRHWPLARHYLEMLAAMGAGMVVFGLLGRGALDALGAGPPRGGPEVAALEMAAYMSAGMVLWMRYRDHGWAGTLEMTAAMFASALVFFPALWLGLVSGHGLMMGEHLLMLPLMAAVMWRRRGEFGG
ncbi:hypothetical protein [Streptomyces sp. NPDC005438]|uniref:hypothetical protein n=1 Tax=Streptomyces sp. NPDC005438 TaxID=3156880 RepID=UPI00339DAE8E